jgi:hypothetical protein
MARQVGQNELRRVVGQGQIGMLKMRRVLLTELPCLGRRAGLGKSAPAVAPAAAPGPGGSLRRGEAARRPVP